MKKAISISLGRHRERLELTESANELLETYLAESKAALRDDPDRDEIIEDLEHAIGEKLLRSEPDSQIDIGPMEEALRELGPVDGAGSQNSPAELPAPKRFVRVDEGKWIAGVCVGIAVRGSYDVGWVRTVFILLALVTGGAIAIVYLGLALWLPVVPTAAEYRTHLNAST